MARQLVFTSAPQGLTPGRTGFGTVARHRDLRERLVPALEGLSVYPSGLRPAPVICLYRRVEVGGTTVPVLTRIVDAGHDYTHRTNFLAHHLILEPEEVATAPAPAEIFLRWPGWLDRWDGAPRWFDAAELVDLRKLPPAGAPALPAATWQRLTGDAGRAALLLDQNKAAARVLALAPGREGEMLALFRETSALLERADAWDATFTNWVQPADSPRAGGWRWIGLTLAAGEAPPANLAGQNILNLNNPSDLPAAPVTAAARRAREGAGRAGPASGRTAAAPPRPVAPGARGPAGPAAAPAAAAGRAGWLGWALGGLVLAGAAALAWLWLGGRERSAPVPAPAPPPPVARPPTAEDVPARGPATAAPALATTQTAIANEQKLQEIRALRDAGKFADGLARWRELQAAAPGLARLHESALYPSLLAGVRTEWQARFHQLAAELDAGPVAPARRESWAGQLAQLQALPRAWGLADAPALERDCASLGEKLALLDRLPGAPVLLADGIARQGGGPDFEEFSCTLAAPELRALLNARDVRPRIALAQAPGLALPAADQWYEFDLQRGDVSPGDYLILHDASRGVAGGRYLQVFADGAEQVRLTWRIFSPASDFFRLYPANRPLRADARRFWLRFSGEGVAAPFYLLIRQAVPSSTARWEPLRLPLAWLAVEGAPARVALPGWLARALPLRAAAATPLVLLPAAEPGEAAWRASRTPPALTAAAAQFQAAWLAAFHDQEARIRQTELERARQQVRELERLAREAPPGQRPDNATIDQAGLAVEKLTADIGRARAAAQAAGQPDWPRTAAPWRLWLGPDPRRADLLLEFSPDATGPTP